MASTDGQPADRAAAPGPVLHVTGWRLLLVRAVLFTLRQTLRVSPRPMAMVIRREFARGGAATKRILERHAPAGVVVRSDERYGPGADELLDVYLPAATNGPGSAALPTVVWIHGGGWVGGAKEEVGGYLKLLADRGFVGVAIRYTRAPEGRYPTPVRQTMAALAYVRANADRLHVDRARLFLAGDSAGAQIAAQVAALVTDPGYAQQVRIEPTVDRTQLRAVALCCGAYDPELIPETGPFSSFLTAILWSYSGIRHFRHDRYFSTMAVVDHLSGSFPPAFITAGNADPLVEHSRRLATALAAQGVEIDALFYPADHEPPLQHEYQFDLDLHDAETAFSRLVAFFERHAGY